jgi:LmbE family N-acetylglucosaminyl deacetylase
MNILAIMAHPDDAEFQCTGTLILLKKMGHKIGILTVNNGSCGTAVASPKEIVAVRAREARRAASFIGAEYFCAGIPDLGSVFSNEHRGRVCEIVRRFDPDIVITHHPQDYMSDHEIASRLARDATFTASLRNYATGIRPAARKIEHIPALYYCLPLESLDHFGHKVRPAFVVKISSVINKKGEMLCRHASQREWLMKQHGMDEYVLFMKREAKRLGALAHFQYGEGFIQHLGHAYPRHNILAELLPVRLTRNNKIRK